MENTPALSDNSPLQLSPLEHLLLGKINGRKIAQIVTEQGKGKKAHEIRVRRKGCGPYQYGEISVRIPPLRDAYGEDDCFGKPAIIVILEENNVR